MRILCDEKGQTLVLTALCGSVLLGFMALALDVGVLFHTKRGLQTAVDAAALAGAQDYLYNHSSSSAQTAACNAAARNGFSGTCSTGTCDDKTSNTICINTPPLAGPETATSTGMFVEAIVKQPTRAVFIGKSVGVMARAVAGTPTNGLACIWVMNPSGAGLDVQGNYSILSPSCGIYVNSNTSDAMGVTGNAGTVNAPFIDVVGNSTLQHQTTPTAATMNSGVRKSPWGNLTGPDSSNCQSGNTVTSTSISSSTTIPSAINGVVCFTGGNTSNPPKISGTMTFPGASSGIVYYFANGVEFNTSSNVTFGSGTYSVSTQTFSNTSGAVLDIGAGTMKQDSNSLLSIYGPTSGSYDGIAIFQPPSNTSTLQVQFGSNNEVLDGYIYAPGGEVYLQDNGGGVTATGIVANKLYDKASTLTVAYSYDKANATTTLNRVLSLVE
jgi:Flp pilus assembly protein TadG